MRSVPVWDLPSRIFHWTLAVAVITSYLTGEEEGLWFVVHTVSGYTVALLLVFRIIWGFLGSVHSRFSDFVCSPRSVKDYAKHLLRLNPSRFVGHNPLGGLMVILMLLVLAGTVATGLLSGDKDVGSGILLPLIAAPGGDGLAEVHEFFGNFIMILAAIHVLAVFVDWFLTKENLVKAMITGRKTLDDAEAGKQRPLVSGWRGVGAAVIVVVLGAVLFQQTDFSAMASAGEGAESGHPSENHEVHDD